MKLLLTMALLISGLNLGFSEEREASASIDVYMTSESCYILESCFSYASRGADDLADITGNHDQNDWEDAFDVYYDICKEARENGSGLLDPVVVSN